MQAFLGAVTYGATGTEYTAINCTVVQNHTAIQCTTAPGTGRFLRWCVTVGGQTSAASANYTSYAAPFIASITPVALPTNGGVAAVLTGTNFATKFTAAKVIVYVNNFNALPPPAAEIASYTSQLVTGSDPVSAVNPVTAFADTAAWLALTTPFVPLVTSQAAKSWGTLSGFAIPAGFGASQSVLVTVSGVPSNIITYS